ncbi:MAG: ketopantoate reductase family protein [Qingshengfaniella sp.]
MSTGKIAVMGAGAVGCYYGAELAQAGETVTLIGRPALAEAVAERGLLLDKAGQTQTIALNAATTAEGVAGADLVIVSVKSGDIPAAGQAIAPHLAPDAILLSFQNGVGNAERLAEATGHPVIPVVVYVATGMAGPGHVRHNGQGRLVFGETPDSERAAKRFRAAGIEVDISPDAETALWEKLTINCVFNALSAVSQLPYGQIWGEPGVETMARAVLAECQAVAAGSGITLPDDLWQAIAAIPGKMAGQYSSTAQDLARGRASEIDYLNGEIVRRAEALGLNVPANTTLWTLVRLAEKSGALTEKQAQ